MEKLKKYIINDIEDIKETPLSDITIEKYLNDPKIIEYSDLKNYKTIDKLLPNNKDYVIILFRHGSGAHWVCLLKNNNMIEHFCSYGSKPDEYYHNWTTKKINDKLGQYEPYITKLLYNCPYDIIYSPIDYQSSRDDIATCGRHILNRLFHFINHNSNLNNYYDYMKRKKNEYHKSYDDLVSVVVNHR